MARTRQAKTGSPNPDTVETKPETPPQVSCLARPGLFKA